MKLKEFSKYLGVFFLGALLIAVYKTFDNLGVIWQWGERIFAVLSPFIFGSGIAFVLYRPCRGIEKLLLKVRISWVNNHRRGIAVVVVYIITLLLVAGFFALLVPSLVQSVMDLVNQAPELWNRAMEGIAKLERWGINLNKLTEAVSVEKLMSVINFSNLSQYAQGIVSAGEGIFNFVMSLIISVYVLLDRHNIKDAASRLVNAFLKKDRSRKTFYKYSGRAFEYMNAYVACKIIDAVIIGVASFFLMLPFGVPYLPLMAIIQAVCNLIPYFGAIISTAIAAAVTMIMVSPMQGVWVIVVLVILQQIDANILQPKLVHETMDVHPLWVIFSILLFGALFGIWGILLGVPVMAIILSAIEDGLRHAELKKEKEN